MKLHPTSKLPVQCTNCSRYYDGWEQLNVHGLQTNQWSNKEKRFFSASNSSDTGSSAGSKCFLKPLIGFRILASSIGCKCYERYIVLQPRLPTLRVPQTCIWTIWSTRNFRAAYDKHFHWTYFLFCCHRQGKSFGVKQQRRKNTKNICSFFLSISTCSSRTQTQETSLTSKIHKIPRIQTEPRKNSSRWQKICCNTRLKTTKERYRKKSSMDFVITAF